MSSNSSSDLSSNHSYNLRKNIKSRVSNKSIESMNPAKKKRRVKKKAPELPRKLVFFDLETTGFNPYSCEIIEIAAKMICPKDPNHELYFERLVKPSFPISSYISKITGITNEMVSKSATIDVVLKEFKKFIGDAKEIILIAHNCNGFDRLFLEKGFSNFQIHHSPYIYLDTMRMAQYILPKRYSHSLQKLCEYFSIIQKNPHRARSDVENLVSLYERLLLLFSKICGVKDSLKILALISI